MVIYEDKDILVINKPAGLTVHADGRGEFGTLADLILKEHPEMAKVGEPYKTEDSVLIERPGIVHRLDRETSGIMVLAKNKKSFTSLKEQFKNHEVKKHYIALVIGSFRASRGVIDQPIGRSSLDIRKWAAGVHARGEKRDALTRYSVRGVGKAEGKEGQGKNMQKVMQTVSLVDLYPQTGRTHQIRVHMQYIQHPIIADSLYAPYLSKMLKLKRQALHSYEITFTHPTTGKKVNFKADIPKDMSDAIKMLDII